MFSIFSAMRRFDMVMHRDAILNNSKTSNCIYTARTDLVRSPGLHANFIDNLCIPYLSIS